MVQTTAMSQINSDASLEKLVDTYIDAASELRSAQAKLGNTHDETYAFIAARDALREHPAFEGTLPKTFFSGGSMDPEGVDGNGSDGNTPDNDRLTA
jgi:hypothetical protein